MLSQDWSGGWRLQKRKLEDDLLRKNKQLSQLMDDIQVRDCCEICHALTNVHVCSAVTKAVKVRAVTRPVGVQAREEQVSLLQEGLEGLERQLLEAHQEIDGLTDDCGAVRGAHQLMQGIQDTGRGAHQLMQGIQDTVWRVHQLMQGIQDTVRRITNSCRVYRIRSRGRTSS